MHVQGVQPRQLLPRVYVIQRVLYALRPPATHTEPESALGAGLGGMESAGNGCVVTYSLAEVLFKPNVVIGPVTAVSGCGA